MKDYSKYVGDPYGFITDIKITPSKISITTAKSDENEPHEYDIQTAQFYLERYEKQYNLIIDNQDRIIEGETKKYRTLCLVGLLIALASIGLVAISVSKIFCFIILVTGISTALNGVKEIYNYKKEFTREIKIYKGILKNRNKIESAIQNDRNVTKYLDEKTSECLEENESLKDIGVVENVININFIDKTSLEGLSKLLKMTKISNALQEEPMFLNPIQKNGSKKKTRKPNSQK